MSKLYISVWIILIAGLSGCQKRKQPEYIDIVELTIAEIHKAYEEGSYNSQKLVNAYLDRIKENDHDRSYSFYSLPTMASIKRF